MNEGGKTGVGTHREGKPAVFERRIGLEHEYSGPAACEVGKCPARGAYHADNRHGEERPDTEGLRGEECLRAWLPGGGCDTFLVYWDADKALPGTALGRQCLERGIP